MVATRTLLPALRVLVLAAGLGLAASPGHAAPAAPPLALLTIADGPVELVRGAARHAAREGLALAGDDIVRTGPGTRVARIEFADGRVLDLGPDTQALLLSEAAAAPQGLADVAAVVAQGWAKLGTPRPHDAATRPLQLAAADMLAAAPAGGSLLLRVDTAGQMLAFAERHGLALSPRARPGTRPASPAVRLREGEAWLRPAGATSGRVAWGAALPALRETPRALADSLPRRAARFAGRAIDVDAGEPLDADDLAPWLRAEPALIAALRPRLAALSRQAMRRAAQAGQQRRPAARPTVRTAVHRPAPRPAATPPVPRLVPGLAAPQDVALPTAVAALEATALLPTERAHAALPPLHDAGAPLASAPRPPARTARSAQAALASPPRTVAP